MNEVYEKLLKEKGKVPDSNAKVGVALVWHYTLLQYNSDGTCNIIRSFTKPAKGFYSKKNGFSKIRIEDVEEEQSLFESK